MMIRVRSLFAKLFKTTAATTAATPSAAAPRDAAQTLREQQEKAAQSLKLLEAARQDIATQRKDNARRKIDQVRAQLAAVRMMGRGDPKAVARHVARLARELSSASRDYASTGGTPQADPRQHALIPLVDAADSAFAEEARRLAGEVEDMARATRDRMGAKAGTSQDLREVFDALRDVRKSLHRVEQPDSAASGTA